MGTKNNPNEFDCYANAEADEPMFVLLARDRLAPHLTNIWALIRAGNRSEARLACSEMLRSPQSAFYVLHHDSDKAVEAVECASAMIEWRKVNRP